MGTFIDFRFVKTHASFKAVLAHYGITLKGTGDEHSALCPFHQETKPSFKVNLAKKAFQCFGCGAKGNVLDFVEKKEGCDLRQAAEMVADICGIALSDRATGTHKAPHAERQEKPLTEPDMAKERLVEPEKRTSAPPERNKPLSFRLQSLDPEHSYLVSRLSPTLIEHFELGYCDRGLMKGRIAIPIHDEEDELVAYAGRWASDEVPEDAEKYLLPPKFRKTLVLFNLSRLVRPLEHVVMVEGYFGAMRLHGLHMPAVALMGRSISDEQVALLQEAGVRRISLMMDGDDPGRNAALEILLRLARSFFVRNCDLPDGGQPDTVDEEVLQELVEPVSE